MNLRLRALLLEALKAMSEAPPTDLQLQEWTARIHAALDEEMPSDAQTRKLLSNVLGTIYAREVEKNGVAKRVPDVLRYTLDRVAPELRAELDRRIYAGVDLIRLNKRERTEQTLKRFAGWLSSVPPGGTSQTDLRSVAQEILKPAAQVKFEARRVAIDQGHKLVAAVAHIVAKGEGAIAAVWHDRGEHDAGYDARPEHLARSGKLFLVRDSWAMQDGLIRKCALQYTDEIEQPAELPFCSCTYRYITSPGALPEALLTAKGREWVKGAA
jgi:hypothetical protein